MRTAILTLLLFCTACSDPVWSTGTELELRAQTESSIGVIWDDATPVSEYRVYLDNELVQTHPAGVNETTIEELAEASAFVVEVVAVNLWGGESERLTLQVQTADRTAPVFPEGAQVEAEVGYNIVLRWPEASDAYGPLQYIVRSGDELVPRRGEPGSTHGDLVDPRIEVIAVDPSNNESEPLVIEWTEEEFETMLVRRRALEAEHIRSLGLDPEAMLAGAVPEGADPFVMRRLLERTAAARATMR